MRLCFCLNSLVWVAGLDGWRAKVMDLEIAQCCEHFEHCQT